jgi:hypothetical protein
MDRLGKIFREHPESVGETYGQHMMSAFGFGILLLAASMACLIHGLMPWLLKTKGSETVRVLYDRMINERRRRTSDRGGAPADSV